MRPQPACPECEKLAAVADDSNPIGQFIDWMRSNDLEICELVEGEFEWGSYEPVYLGNSGINRLLAKYFDIDLDKVEQERRALLEWLQERHENH